MNSVLRSIGFALVMGMSLPALQGCGGAEDVESGDEQDVTASTAKFETFVGSDKQHYFQMVAANGENLLHSEGYTSTTGAKNGIASVKKNGVIDARYKMLQAKNGESYFNLIAGNGEIIATSEMYATKSNATRAATTIKSILASASSGAATTGPAKFATFTGDDTKVYFNLRAANGEIVLRSQGYTTKSSATKGIASVEKNGVDAKMYELLEAANGQFYFRLKAGNGQVIAYGETYPSKSNAQRGMDTVVDALVELSDD